MYNQHANVNEFVKERASHKKTAFSSNAKMSNANASNANASNISAANQFAMPPLPDFGATQNGFQR